MSNCSNLSSKHVFLNARQLAYMCGETTYIQPNLVGFVQL